MSWGIKMYNWGMKKISFMGKKRINIAPLNKVISLIVTGAFLLNTAIVDLAWAREVSPVLSPVGAAADSGPGHSLVDKIKVPQAYGSIKESFKGSSNKLIIQIQDIHSNYEGQKNLANILISLIESHQLKVVLVEGGITDRDFSYLRMWHPLEERKTKAEKLLKDGVITGEAYVNIATNYPLKFQGVEDRELYEKNMDAYLKTELFAEEGLELIMRLRNTVDNLKRHMYNRTLKGFDNKLTSYHNEEIGFTEYLSYLEDLARVNDINLKEFPNYQAIMELTRLEKRIDFAKVERERDELVEKITDSGSDKRALEELYNKGTEFKEGKISQNEFYNYLIDLAKAVKTDLGAYKNLTMYVDYINAYSDLDISGLFEDINKLEDTLAVSLCRNEDEKTLAKISKNIAILEKFLKLKLIPQDFAYFKTNKRDFYITDWLAFISSRSAKFELTSPVPDDVSIIDDNVATLESFYKAAIERDNAFVENSLRKMEKEGESLACLVAGGFHTENLTHIFKERGISYVIIAPKAATTTDDNIYKKELKDSFTNRIWDEIAPGLVAGAQLRRSRPEETVTSVVEVGRVFNEPTLRDVVKRVAAKNSSRIYAVAASALRIPDDSLPDVLGGVARNRGEGQLQRLLEDLNIRTLRVPDKKLLEAMGPYRELLSGVRVVSPGGGEFDLGMFMPQPDIEGEIIQLVLPQALLEEKTTIRGFVGPEGKPYVVSTEDLPTLLPPALQERAGLVHPKLDVVSALGDMLRRGRVTERDRDFVRNLRITRPLVPAPRAEESARNILPYRNMFVTPEVGPGFGPVMISLPEELERSGVASELREPFVDALGRARPEWIRALENGGYLPEGTGRGTAAPVAIAGKLSQIAKGYEGLSPDMARQLASMLMPVSALQKADESVKTSPLKITGDIPTRYIPFLLQRDIALPLALLYPEKNMRSDIVRNLILRASHIGDEILKIKEGEVPPMPGLIRSLRQPGVLLRLAMLFPPEVSDEELLASLRPIAHACYNMSRDEKLPPIIDEEPYRSVFLTQPYALIYLAIYSDDVEMQAGQALRMVKAIQSSEAAIMEIAEEVPERFRGALLEPEMIIYLALAYPTIEELKDVVGGIVEGVETLPVTSLPIAEPADKYLYLPYLLNQPTLAMHIARERDEAERMTVALELIDTAESLREAVETTNVAPDYKTALKRPELLTQMAFLLKQDYRVKPHQLINNLVEMAKTQVPKEIDSLPLTNEDKLSLKQPAPALRLALLPDRPARDKAIEQAIKTVEGKVGTSPVTQSSELAPLISAIETARGTGAGGEIVTARAVPTALEEPPVRGGVTRWAPGNRTDAILREGGPIEVIPSVGTPVTLAEPGRITVRRGFPPTPFTPLSPQGEIETITMAMEMEGYNPYAHRLLGSRIYSPLSLERQRTPAEMGDVLVTFTDFFKDEVSRQELWVTLHRMQEEGNTVNIRIVDSGVVLTDNAVRELRLIVDEFDFVEIATPGELVGEQRRVIAVGYEDQENLISIKPDVDRFIPVRRPTEDLVVSVFSVLSAAFAQQAELVKLISREELERLLRDIISHIHIDPTQRGEYQKRIQEIYNQEHDVKIKV